jgi:DNA replication and repair protein RecF
LLRIKKISPIQFKNYKQASFSFTERIIGICGNNGIGKTNLLDAIYYLCFTKSYFSKSDQLNEHTGNAGFRIEGSFELGGNEQRVVCILRETGKKEFSVNEEVYEKFSSHIGKFPCVIITPDDVQIITGGSEERRRFTDTLLSQVDTKYLQQLIKYNKLIQQRNSLLKSMAENKIKNNSLLQVYDEQLSNPGNYIFDQRKAFLQDLLPLVKKLYTEIAGREEEIDLVYASQLDKASFETLLLNSREKDLFTQRSNTGIHKDDIEITLNRQAFRNNASQGQRKSLLFAMKLAEFETLKKEKGFSPILLLDDVFEKLDEQRMYNLLDRVCLQNLGQIFITDTHMERISGHFQKLQINFQTISLPQLADK